MMKKNEASWDRGLRLVLGLIIGVLAFVSLSGVWQVLAIIVALILLFTAATGSCLLYSALGVNTLKKDSEEPGATEAPAQAETPAETPAENQAYGEAPVETQSSEPTDTTQEPRV